MGYLKEKKSQEEEHIWITRYLRSLIGKYFYNSNFGFLENGSKRQTFIHEHQERKKQSKFYGNFIKGWTRQIQKTNSS